MKKRSTLGVPSYMVRPRESDTTTMKHRISQAQKQSERIRGPAKISLAKAPWEEDESCGTKRSVL